VLSYASRVVVLQIVYFEESKNLEPENECLIEIECK
jgi:hypothetical protein